MRDISIEEGMTEEEIDYIKNKLFQFNISTAPPDQRPISKDINLILKDEDKIYGGLIGKIYRGCLLIETLWLSEDVRGFGYGEKLMMEAEKIAIAEECRFIHLDTFSFQAPEFYKKNGYKGFGVLEGYPDGTKRYYLKKDL
ncbi:GNAT family N-acetyltransferase [Gudongella sp. DL1XJH-153]|uniref:GNAT family N-acetyltransferase n=1 Tax=Gudongella sp. DL1XJH-153 TaxID=3409804 RepID=UPI003BB4911B